MRVTFRLNAGPDEVFTQEAARSLVGQRPKFNAREYDGGPISADYGHCVVVAAEVVDEGRAMLVTYEPENPVELPDLGNLPGFSFGVARDFEDTFERFMADNAETLRRLADGQP